jgi:hypothetical protein
MTLPHEGCPSPCRARIIARRNNKEVPDVVRDIREGPVEEYWDRLREMLGPDGLITYWYLGRTFNQTVDPDTVRLRRDMRNNTGGIMAAPLAIAAPETGGWRDREAIPAPVTYGLHILDDARDVAEIRGFPRHRAPRRQDGL